MRTAQLCFCPLPGGRRCWLQHQPPPPLLLLLLRTAADGVVARALNVARKRGLARH